MLPYERIAYYRWFQGSWGPGIKAQGLWRLALGCRAHGWGLKAQVSGTRAQGPGPKAQGSGPRALGLGLRFKGLGSRFRFRFRV